jgi:hypothetical protein
MGKTRPPCPPEFKFELKRGPSVAPTKGLADSLTSPYFIAVLCTCYNASAEKVLSVSAGGGDPAGEAATQTIFGLGA